MMLVLRRRDSSSKRKHCVLETSMTRPRYTARWMQQSMAFWYLFNSTTRKVDSTNIALKHLLSKATGKRLGEEEVQFDCFNRSCIQAFDNVQHQGYSKTQWHNLLSGAWWSLMAWPIKWSLVKLSGVTHHVEPKDWSRGKRKARPEGLTWRNSLER